MNETETKLNEIIGQIWNHYDSIWPKDMKLTYSQFRMIEYKCPLEASYEDQKAILIRELEKYGATLEDYNKCYQVLYNDFLSKDS